VCGGGRGTSSPYPLKSATAFISFVFSLKFDSLEKCSFREAPYWFLFFVDRNNSRTTVMKKARLGMCICTHLNAWDQIIIFTGEFFGVIVFCKTIIRTKLYFEVANERGKSVFITKCASKQLAVAKSLLEITFIYSFLSLIFNY